LELDAAELTGHAEEILRPTDVHDGEGEVGAGRGVVGMEEAGDGKGVGAAAGADAEGIADAEVVLCGEWDADDHGAVGAEEGFGVEGEVGIGGLEVPSGEGSVGEEVDAGDAEVGFRMVGEGDDSFDQWGGGGDAGCVAESGPYSVGEGEPDPANFEMGACGEEVNACLEGADGTAVGRLDSEIDRAAEGDGGDVEEDEEWMAEGIPDDETVQDAKEGDHGTGDAERGTCRV